MPQSTFVGGVHPYDGKDMSKIRTIKTVFPKGEMVYPLKQHMGDPAVPVVYLGEHVLSGHLIAAARSNVSANIHASVSGYVRAIEPRRCVDGHMEQSIVILNDQLFEEIDYPQPRHFEDLDKETILSAVYEAGVVGMGGAGMPTHVKLSVERPGKIDYCIANCIECEPYLTSDYRRLVENPAKVLNGLRIIMKLFRRARGIIAVDEKNVDVYRMFRELAREDKRIYVKKLENKYPQGAERQLIYALTGRKLNASMLTEDIGCLVHNVDTLVAVNQAVMVYEPLITRLVTVTGDCIREPRNYRVRIGMSYREVLAKAGDFVKTPELILDGGTMTGSQIVDLDAPITKLSSAIVVLSKDRTKNMKETPCIRCGRCVTACPNHLVPLQLYKDALADKQVDFLQHGGLECSGCEACSYTCPARIRLCDIIRKKSSDLLKDPELSEPYGRRRSKTWTT